MPVTYKKKENDKFALGYFSKVGESAVNIDFSQCIVWEDGNFFYIGGHCEGWDIVNYDDKNWVFEPQLMVIRGTAIDHEYEYNGEKKQRTGSASEKAFLQYMKKQELLDKPLSLEIDFGTKGNKSAEIYLEAEAGKRELTEHGYASYVENFIKRVKPLDELTKFSQADISEFATSRGSQGGRGKYGGKGYSKSLSERVKAAYEAVDLEGEPNFLELYAFVSDLDKENLKALIELLEIS